MEAVIIDNGTGYIKAGLSSNENCPKTEFPNVVAGDLVGKEAMEKRKEIELKYPMQGGKIKDWEAMEKVWHYVYEHELKVNPAEHPLLLTEAPGNPRDDKVKICQTFFEKFGVPSINISRTPGLNLYAAGLFTALVVESGHGTSCAAPYCDGSVDPYLIQRFDVGGNDITHQFMKLLTDSKIIEEKSDPEFFREVKEKLCYVSMCCPSEPIKEQPCTLPDGKNITIKEQAFCAPEVLFCPDLITWRSTMGTGIGEVGFGQKCFDAVDNSDMSLKKGYYQNILLCGEGFHLKGLQERLEAEIKNCAPEFARKFVKSTMGPKHGVYCGAAVLSTITTFESVLVTKQEFAEKGESVLLTKFK
ncbi:MAG: actin family protein [archaeon]|nr:actin family protein [archaeon]